MASYGTDDHYEAFYRYESGQSLRQMARSDDMPSRATLNRWKQEGLPLDLTGGDDWDDVIERRRRQAVQRSAHDDKVQGAEDFFDEQRRRIRKMLDIIFTQIEQGKVEVDAGDFSNLLSDYMTLDNRKADQVEWMREVFTLMLEAVNLELMQTNIQNPEDVFDRVKSRLVALEKDQRQKLGTLPNKRKFTGEAELTA